MVNTFREMTRPPIRTVGVLSVAGLMLGILISLSLPTNASTGISVISYTAGNSGAAVTSHIITIPSSGLAGDLLITCLSINGIPSVTWPAGWSTLTLTVSSTVITTSCDYIFDTGSLGTTFTVTTGATQGDANISYRIRNAKPYTSPLINSPIVGTSSGPATGLMLGSTDEFRLFLPMFAWSLGSVAITSYGSTLSTYAPTPPPGIQSAWSNAAGTGVFSVYKIIAEDTEPIASLGFGSSVNSIRFFISVRPASATSTTTDLSSLWIILAIFVLLLLIGLRLPFVHIFAGLLGLFLGYQLYTVLADLPLSAIVLGVSVLIFMEGFLRRV